ncbi:hypothetical protein Nepgr_030836 [Nepenthes gracilis]|uniref:Glycoside hydrolase family 13 N-terminal domain-containing protein n=1 Tax=Nepenthes gracilis TaxID=150966 RepID=A0AAD3Y4L9_NEPGR|nr:hypothetical protein Nepgr_030836 [Nepenthes gracilis]
MAMLQSLFAVRSCGLNRRVSEPLKLDSSTCCFFSKNVPNCEDKMDTHRKHQFGKVSFKAHALSSISVDLTEKKSRYMFRTENGGQVKVVVGKRQIKYLVHIEVSASQNGFAGDKLVLSWGIYRSDSASFIPLDFQSSSPKANEAVFEAPFMLNSFGSYGLEMEFESYLAPFYLSFLLKQPFTDDSTGSDMKSHRGKNFCVPVGFGSGSPSPLGLSFASDGSVNFALFSRNAESVILCLYDDDTSKKPVLEIELDPYINRTGHIWHASVGSRGAL